MAGARRALIVATDDYTDTGLSDLTAPELDAAQLQAVLDDPAIGGFEVTALLNQPEHEVRRALARFFGTARSSDELLLHVTCHGVKAPDGQLYLATTDTDLSLLQATAVSAEFVNAVMEDSRARSILLMLDCCYAGAFAKGMSAKAAGPVDVDERLGGSGRAVITATDALQFAFEGSDLVHGDISARPSVFTDVVVGGLRSGDADRDQDGRVTLEEFYSYVHDEVRHRNPQQTPRLFLHDVSGDLVVANRSTPATRPSPLPEKLREDLASEAYWTRLGVVTPLLQHLTGQHPGRALAARLALEELARDPDDRVKAEARAALASVPVETRPGPDPASPEPETEPEPGPSPVPGPEEGPDEGPAPGPAPETEGGPGAGPAPDGDPEPGPAPDRGLGPEPVPGPPRPDPRPDPDPHPWWRSTGVRAAAAAATVLLVAVTAWSLRPDGGTGGGGGDPGDLPTPRGEPIPDSVVLLVRVQDGARQLVSIDLSAPEEPVEVLAEDGQHLLPTISPDRRWVVTMAPAGDELEQKVPRLVDTSQQHDEPLLDDEMTERCPFTSRPSWNAESTRLALTCLDGDGEPVGLVVVGLGGAFVTELVAADDLYEAPTWGEDGRVYFLREAADGTTAVWSVDEDGGTPTRDEQIPDGKLVTHLDWSVNGLLFLQGEPGTSEADAWIRPWESGAKPLQISWDGTAGAPTWAPVGAGAVWTSGTGLVVVESPDDGDPDDIDIGSPPGPPAWGSR